MKNSTEKKNISKMKTYPFNKTKFAKNFEKPSLFMRLTNLSLGIRNAFRLFKEPCVNEFNHYPLVFVWGETPDSNLYTPNAISIIYNEEEKMYYLVIETAMSMEDDEMWGNYLLYTLDCFTKFMEQNKLDKCAEIDLFMQEPKIELKARTIEELYTYYRMFVNAYLCTFDLFPEDEDIEDGEDFEEEDEELI